jgi:hypothetical protein
MDVAAPHDLDDPASFVGSAVALFQALRPTGIAAPRPGPAPVKGAGERIERENDFA